MAADQVRNPSYAFSGETTEFDDILIKHGVITKEQALLNKGMDPDAVAEIIVKEKLTEMGFFDEPDLPTRRAPMPLKRPGATSRSSTSWRRTTSLATRLSCNPSGRRASPN